MKMLVVVFVLLSSFGNRKKCAFHMNKKPTFAEIQWR
jgi:hypothetical protein